MMVIAASGCCVMADILGLPGIIATLRRAWYAALARPNTYVPLLQCVLASSLAACHDGLPCQLLQSWSPVSMPSI